MTATLTEARDEILSTFKAAWDADSNSQNIVVFYDDTRKDLSSETSWVRISVQHNIGYQATLTSASMNQRWRRKGIVFVQVFTPLGDGMKTNDVLSSIVRNAFEGKTTSKDIIFRNVSIREIGESEKWFQTNVVAEFEYDEIK